MKFKKLISVFLTACITCGMAATMSYADTQDEDAYIDKLVDEMTITETVITVKGLTQTYTYLQVADSHSNLFDDDTSQINKDYAAQQGVEFDKGGVLAADRLKAAFKYAENMKVDGIWLTGDNVDSASLKNRTLLFSLIDNAKGNGIDVTYTMGNHDWNLRDIYFTNEAKQTLLPLYKDYMGGDSYIERKEIKNKDGKKELLLISVNNSEDIYTTDQTRKIKSSIENGDVPVIMIQHVPFQTDTLTQISMERWGKDISFGEKGSTGISSDQVQKVYDVLKGERSSNIVGVFAGHFHYENDEKIKNTNVDQYVTEAGYKGNARLITLKPEPCEVHTWVEATCQAPKTCSVCGETEGTKLEHQFADATCTEPKTCTLCNETEGEPLGHDFVDGVCTRCQEKDPDSEPKLLGDVNDDGEINDIDSILLTRYVGGVWKGVIIKEVNADVDGKKGITDSDSIRLIRYVGGVWKGVVLQSPEDN